MNTDDADLTHRFAKFLQRFDSEEMGDVSNYAKAAESLVEMAREHFICPLPPTQIQMLSISHWGMFPIEVIPAKYQQMVGRFKRIEFPKLNVLDVQA